MHVGRHSHYQTKMAIRTGNYEGAQRLATVLYRVAVGMALAMPTCNSIPKKTSLRLALKQKDSMLAFAVLMSIHLVT